MKLLLTSSVDYLEWPVVISGKRHCCSVLLHTFFTLQCLTTRSQQFQRRISGVNRNFLKNHAPLLIPLLHMHIKDESITVRSMFYSLFETCFTEEIEIELPGTHRITLVIIPKPRFDRTSLLQFTRVTGKCIPALMYYWFPSQSPSDKQYSTFSAPITCAYVDWVIRFLNMQPLALQTIASFLSLCRRNAWMSFTWSSPIHFTVFLQIKESQGKRK